jgi:hypothetical protein
MNQLAVEPYWVNAARWWIDNHPGKSGEYPNFLRWLEDQGVIVVARDSYYPWINFHSAEHAVIFQLRWCD